MKILKKNKLAQAKHIKLLDLLNEQSMAGFKKISKMLKKDILSRLREKRLVKSVDDFTKLPTGWTGEVNQITIDLNKVLGDVLGRYIKAMKWMLLGEGAGKECTEIAKELGIDKLVTPGIVPSAYLHSIDTQRLHGVDITGQAMPEMANDLLKASLLQIKNRENRILDELESKMYNRIFNALETIFAEKKMDDIETVREGALDKLGEVGGQEALDEAIDGLSSTIGKGKFTESIDDVLAKFEEDWEKVSKTEVALGSAVGTHESMVELYGAENKDIKVIIQGYYDDRQCDWCWNVAKNPDGSFKEYHIGDLKPAGYNFGKKKAEWLPSVSPFHHNCRCMITYLHQGWHVDKNGDLIPPK